MKHLIPVTALALLLQAQAGLAQPAIAGPTIERVQSDGFVVSEVKRTWLGRIVVSARNATHMREIVLNRTTGAILSDQLFVLPDPDKAPARPAAGMSGTATMGQGDGGMGGGGRGDGGQGDGGQGDGGMGGGGMGGGG